MAPACVPELLFAATTATARFLRDARVPAWPPAIASQGRCLVPDRAASRASWARTRPAAPRGRRWRLAFSAIAADHARATIAGYRA
jgi:hypothetical protein